MGVEPTVADLQSAALATWLRRLADTTPYLTTTSDYTVSEAAALAYTRHLTAQQEPIANTPAILCWGPMPVNGILIALRARAPPKLIDYEQTSSLTFVAVLRPSPLFLLPVQ